MLAEKSSDLAVGAAVAVPAVVVHAARFDAAELVYQRRARATARGLFLHGSEQPGHDEGAADQPAARVDLSAARGARSPSRSRWTLAPRPARCRRLDREAARVAVTT